MCHNAWLASLVLMLYFLSFRGPKGLERLGSGSGPKAPNVCFLRSSPVKKPGLLKIHQFEADPFDSGSEGSEGLGSCVSSLSTLIGTVADTSEEKYRLLDQRDRIMRQGMTHRDTFQIPCRVVLKQLLGSHRAPPPLTLGISDKLCLVLLCAGLWR